MLATVLRTLIPVILVLLAATPAKAGSPGDLCFRQTALKERLEGIPEHLLAAIALAESGRWDQDSRENVAWPWTVTSGGEGRFFPTKRAAVEEVRRLMARGVGNIDVGCMQVNLHYHGDNFVSLEQAFDPAANVGYAVDFLKRLHRETGSWTQAATYYHSRTPEHARRYQTKVVGLWNQRRAQAVEDRQADTAGTWERVYTPSKTVDRDLMARLNENFRDRRQLARAEDRGQVMTFRQGGDMAAVAAARRARLAEQRHEALWESGRVETQADFAERRRAQLKAWRMGRGLVGG